MEVKEVHGLKHAVIYLDELSFNSFFRLFSLKGKNKVIILEAITSRKQKFLYQVVKAKNIDISEAVFFSGNFKNCEGESLPFFARRTAAYMAFKAAGQVVETNTTLALLNSEYGRDTIKLFIAKKLHLEIESWVHRILISKVLAKTQPAEIWLQQPSLFDHALLTENFPCTSIHFYKSNSLGNIRLGVTWLMFAVRSVRSAFGIGKHYTGHDLPKPTSMPSVLMFQENTNIRFDRRLRAQPHHWLRGDSATRKFDTYLIETRSFKIGLTDDNKSKVEQEGLIFVSMSALRHALQKNKNAKELSKIRTERKATLRAFFSEDNYTRKYFLLQVFFLQKQAEKIGALALWLNVKVFLNREPQNVFADGIQLLARSLNITTVTYQYSNMGSISPLMMTTADKMLVFSEGYKKIYEYNGIGPNEFLIGGYLYDGIAKVVMQKAMEHRTQLNAAGAKFIICYFDETVETSRWGLVSKKDHLDELHELAKLILSDAQTGLVLKSQYMRNSPSQLYPDDTLIQNAKATGRYLELMEGVHRNEIYPTEAALVSDLCISHKFGATAGLEAAVAGVRTVLLDTYGCTTIHDETYGKADIIYQTMDSLMEAIAVFRAGTGHYDLGDWSGVLPYFDPYCDGDAPGRLYDTINESVS